MIWLEMSRDTGHGNGMWGFTHSLWAPSHKKGGTEATWAFWETLLAVRDGDPVVHLRGSGRHAAFVGTSLADGDGFATQDRPPTPGPWGHARSFYRVRLKEFSAFADPIPLRQVFTERAADLRSYFLRNASALNESKRRLFYVIQSGRLQCLNGAYLSEIDDELAATILGPDLFAGTTITRPAYISVLTGEQLQTVAARQGQRAFSAAVRMNYGGRCCFPGCPVDDSRFLVGAHIARWADAPELRGDVSNGLCLCLMHDRAFELGLFVLTLNGDIVTTPTPPSRSAWLSTVTAPNGESLRFPSDCIRPSTHAIQKHWDRVGLVP